MIDQLPPPPRVSLVEAVLARWLRELSGVHYDFTDYQPHCGRRKAGGPVRLEDIVAARRGRQAPYPESSPVEGSPSEPAPSEPELFEPPLESTPVEPSPSDPAEPASSAPQASEPPRVDSAPGKSVQPAIGDVQEAGDEEAMPERFVSFARLLEAGAGHLAVARAAYREQCRQAAVQVRELAAFAAQRPAAVLDRPDAEVGSAAVASRAARPAALTAVSEWAVDEVMVALGLSWSAAAGLLADSITLAERLPATLAALEQGRIGWAHARAMAELVGPVKDEARGEVEARLLARAEGRTVTQLRVAARRAVLRADAAAAAARLAAAIRARSVRAYPGEDGMGSLLATLPIPLMAACRRTLEAYAEECRTPGDERTKQQRMADCLVDLILRPGINGPVRIGLTVVAGVDTLAGGDEPGEVDGHPVPAVVVRELAYTLGLLPRPEAETVPDAAPETETVTAAAARFEPEAPEPEAVLGRGVESLASAVAAGSGPAAPTPGPAAAVPDQDRRPPLRPDEAAAARLGELLGLRTTVGTALAHLPAIAIVDEISGQLLALTDATQI